MRYLILLIILTINFSCISQKSELKRESTPEFSPPFNNQGEQADYWAQEFFKNKYRKVSYKTYAHIKEQNGTKFIYDNKSFEVHGADETLKIIFSKGILYPQLISGYTNEPRISKKELNSLPTLELYFYELKKGDNLTITNLEELEFLSKSPKIKRFRFWLGNTKFGNPQVYLIELTNEKADVNIALKEFIEDSKLTFLKEGWLII